MTPRKISSSRAMSQAIIFGSSRSFGKTRAVVDALLSPSNTNFFDLNAYAISPFDYDHANRDDDFIPLIEKLLTFDTWIIATPVYWYNMSTQHKLFFDRFSDLLTIRKDLGRQLKGKKLFVIASFGDSYPQGFEDTFKQICDYLGMRYLGSCFFYSGSANQEYLTNNATQARLVGERLSITTP